MKSIPYTACGHMENAMELQGHIAVALRGGCMFAAKARGLQQAGAIGVIFIGEFSCLYDELLRGIPVFSEPVVLHVLLATSCFCPFYFLIFTPQAIQNDF